MDLVLDQPARPRRLSPALEPADAPILPAPRAPYPPARAQSDRAQFWVQVTLFTLVVALLFFAIALPISGPRRGAATAERRLVETRLVLAEIRAVLADFRADHGIWPGQGLDGRGDPGLLTDQLVHPTGPHGVVLGPTTQREARGRIRGPYRDGGVPANPVTGLSSVRFLRADEPWPDECDGRTGWLYRPATGEIRANVPGRPFAASARYLDL